LFSYLDGEISLSDQPRLRGKPVPENCRGGFSQRRWLNRRISAMLRQRKLYELSMPKNPPADWGLEERRIQGEEVSSKSGNIGQQYRHFFAPIFAGRPDFALVMLPDPEVYEFLRLRKEYSDSRRRGVAPNRSRYEPLFNKGLDPLGKDSLY